MKTSTTRLLTIAFALLFVGTALAGSRDRSHRSDRERDHISWHNDRSDHTSIDMKHGSVVIEHNYRRETSTVEITKDYELYIDDELV